MARSLNDAMLAIHSLFISLQGEGRFAGYPTVFLRLAGCNLSCAWCDATAAAAGRPTETISVTEAASRLLYPGLRDICITGGEPLSQEPSLAVLFSLLPADRRVTIETNGTYPIAELRSRFPSLFFSVDWKTPSAGETSFDMTNLDAVGANGWIKFVVAERHDLDFVVVHAPQAAARGIEVYVSPVFERGATWFAEVAAFVSAFQNCPLRFQLQLHKLLDIP